MQQFLLKPPVRELKPLGLFELLFSSLLIFLLERLPKPPLVALLLLDHVVVGAGGTNSRRTQL